MHTINEGSDERQQERAELRRSAEWLLAQAQGLAERDIAALARRVLEQVAARAKAPPAVPLEQDFLLLVANLAGRVVERSELEAAYTESVGFFVEAVLEQVNRDALEQHATDPHELKPANDTQPVEVPPHDRTPHVWTCPVCTQAECSHTGAGWL